MNRLSGISFKNNLLLKKTVSSVHNSLKSFRLSRQDASEKLSETINKITEIALKKENASSLNNSNQDTVTYSRGSKYNTSYIPNRKTVSLDTLENAFDSAKQSNLKALENPGSSIIANNQEKYTSVANVINNLNTHFLTDEYYFNGRVTDAEKTAFDRKMVTGQIQNILKEHGVELSSDFSCEFVIDPDDYRIKVENCDDAELKKSIEQALNEGDDVKDFADRNGRNLYNHIYLSSKDYNNSQITHDGQLKRYVNDLIQEKIGINLKDCTNTGDDFITSAGQSVKELFLKQVEEEETTPENILTFKELRTHYLQQVKDFDFTDDNKQVLKISFSNGTLHDLGQSEDFGGDLKFIDEMSSSHKDERKTFTCFI
jgi:hypothetical protein